MASVSIGDIESLAASKVRSRANSRESVKVQKRPSNEALDLRDNVTLQQLGEDYARFLVVYTSTILDGGKTESKSDAASKPKLESRGFKPHTMDNISVRKLCEVSCYFLLLAPSAQPPLTLILYSSLEPSIH
jgi:hypothetical protein